jgi:hypothetical protein
MNAALKVPRHYNIQLTINTFSASKYYTSAIEQS